MRVPHVSRILSHAFWVLIVLCIMNTGSAVHASDTIVPVLPAQRFPLSDVRLLDGPFRKAMELDQAYLFSLDRDRLLAGYRKNAGLPPKATAYGGWESKGICGQMLGHYLSACSMMFAATANERWRERISYCLDELAACQQARSDGFLGGMPNGPELFATIARGEFATNGGADLQGAWVPWYNEHKLLAGLRDVYLYTSDPRARQILLRIGDWAISVCQNLNDEQMQKMLSVEYGGMNEALADLSDISGDPKYLALARRFWDHTVLDPLADGRDDLTGRHANTQIPKLIGAARIYELTGDPRMKKAAETFWNAVVSNRSFVTGSNSDREHFFPLGMEAAKLGPENGETCNVYNMLKLTGHIAQWSGRCEAYDFYERALFNHILGSIDPDSGTCTYFQALEPGRFKVYATPQNSFWCCTGTGMENHARYGADIYTHGDDQTLNVNLFIASELSWKEKGLTLRQETDFPRSDHTMLTFTLQRPTRLALRIRVPQWAQDGIFVEGAVAAHGERGSGYLALDRTWQNGDHVTVRMPMSLHLHRTIDDPTMVAVEDGPIVLAATLGRQDYPPTDHVADQTAYDLLYVPSVPQVVTESKTLDWLAPVGDEPLHFKTRFVGQPRDFEMSPFYAVHHQRYAVYFRLLDSSQDQAVREKRNQTTRPADR